MPALSRKLMILSACVSALVCLGACGKKAPEQGATNNAQPTPAAVTATPTTAGGGEATTAGAGETAAQTTGDAADDPGAGRPPEPPLPVEQVKAVVQAWLDAQNKGDFDAYSKTYAGKFFGIKRIGQSSASFTREGWLKDRGRMFKKKMIVSIDELSVTTSSQSAAARFVQTWASGTFKDVGPKQLVVVREADGSLKIAREEMLESRLVNTAREATIDPALLSMLVRGGKGKGAYLGMVLDPSVKQTPGAGPHRLISRSNTMARSVAAGSVPEAWRGWVGQEVVLYDPEAEACRATVESFDYFVNVYPHFGQIQDWDGEMGGKKASASTVARGLWSLGQDHVRLVARLKPSGECKDALWARLASKPAPVLYTRVANAESSTRHAEEAARKLPFMAKLQRQYEQDGGKGSWLPKQDATVRHFAPKRDGGQSLITVSGISGDGCGAFRGEFWSAWHVKTGQLDKPELLTSPTSPGPVFIPAAAADVDGDGLPELISHDKLARQRGAVWSVILDLEAPSFDCPC